MNRLDYIVLNALFIVAVILALLNQPFIYDPGNGRRPLPQAEAPPLQLRPGPTPERIRRPPLVPPSDNDPLLVIGASPDRSPSSISTGTAFSVDSGGTWLTAHHVAGVCASVYLFVDGRNIPATVRYLDAAADLAVITTRGGSQALPISAAPPEIDERGYSFGYPTGILGATATRLMGRARMVSRDRFAGVGPVLVWSDVRWFPDNLERINGLSGGPMFDESGAVVGILVAGSDRRGRSFTVAPEVLHQLYEKKILPSPSQPAQRFDEVTAFKVDLSVAAEILSRSTQIAKVRCIGAPS